MATLRFYRPSSITAKARAWVTGQHWSHVGVVHAVYDIMVMSESHPSKGAWCRPLSKTPLPDAEIRLDDLDDRWVTAWLSKRWGLRFGVLDAVIASSIPATDAVSEEFLPSASFVTYLLHDALSEKWRVPMGDQLRLCDPRGVTPDILWSGMLAEPD